MAPTFSSVPVLDLLLDRDNPRHKRKDNQEQIIDYLLADEEVYNLARHMSQRGINPLEVIAVYPDDDGNLVVAEGNRRVCAAQILTDVDKAPESQRKRFQALASRSQDVSRVNVAIFPDYATAQPWLQVLHDGEQDGIGRRRWKPEQKARATTGKSTDALAIAVLDHAAASGLITADERRLILVSSATRYLANPRVRSAMGLTSGATSSRIEFIGDEARFTKVIAKFVEDLRTNKAHSRSKTAEWLAYADEVEQEFGTVERGQATRAPANNAISQKILQNPKPTRVRIVSPNVRYIGKSNEVVRLLNKLASVKLSSLYNSLTNVRLDEHGSLLVAGAWVFMESLTALHGRTSGEFQAYINSRLGAWGFEKARIRDFKLSLEYISDNGNAEKHSPNFSALDARNLHIHFEVLSPVICSLLSECINVKNSQ